VHSLNPDGCTPIDLFAYFTSYGMVTRSTHPPADAC
jgi:hypothetical protein